MMQKLLRAIGMTIGVVVVVCALVGFVALFIAFASWAVRLVVWLWQ